MQLSRLFQAISVALTLFLIGSLGVLLLGGVVMAIVNYVGPIAGMAVFVLLPFIFMVYDLYHHPL